MNDEFLTHYQPTVRPEFADRLGKRLHDQARERQRRKHLLAAGATVLLIVSTLTVLPDARAAVHQLIREIGDMVFFEVACGTPEACAETIAEVKVAYADDPDEELAPGTYRIETIVDDLPFSLSLPKVVGGPYAYDDLVHLEAEPARMTVHLNWYPKDCIDESCEAAMTLTISMTGEADAAPLVPDGATTEIFRYFARGPATIYRHERGESGIVWCEEDEFHDREEMLCYRLRWSDPTLSLDRSSMTMAANSLTWTNAYEQSRYIDYEALHATYPGIVDFLPTQVPDNFSNEPTRIVVNRYGSTVGIFWSASVDPDEFHTAPWISMSVWVDRVPFAVREGTLQEVKVGRHPAALYELLVDDQVQILMWRQYGLQYSLAWEKASVPAENIVRMAASVPEKGKLPLPPEQMDDLLRLLLTEGKLETSP
jgi:hypothetical protein